MKRIFTVVCLLAALAAHATIYTTNWTSGANATFANNGVVPDGSFTGWADSRSVSAPAGTISSLAVNLTLTGGWNGDLYAYLVHGSGFTVLLDRVGYTGSGLGYSTSGMNVVFTTGAPSIETTPVPLSGGSYSPDPSYAGSLNSFTGLSGSGTWSLFVADLNSGDITTVSSWGLQMDIVAVPETETWVAAALAGAFGAFWLSRQISGSVRQSRNVS